MVSAKLLKKFRAITVLLLLCLPLRLIAAKILYIGCGATSFNGSKLPSAFACLGHTVTELKTTGYDQLCGLVAGIGGLAQFDQVWDNRFSGSKSGNDCDTLSPCEQTLFANYLNAGTGGKLFLDGENEAFLSRNVSLDAFLNTYISTSGTIANNIIDGGTNYTIKAAPGVNFSPWVDYSSSIHAPGGFLISTIGSAKPLLVNGTGSNFAAGTVAHAINFCGAGNKTKGEVIVFMDSLATSWFGIAGNGGCSAPTEPDYLLLQNFVKFPGCVTPGTFTRTATRSPTRTPTPAQSSPTNTPSRTGTPSNSPTPSATRSFTPTPTASPTRTATSTFSATPTDSPTPTHTPTATSTPTYTASPTFSDSPTATPTATPTPTYTATPTYSDSPTKTATPSPTPTNTPSPTFSDSPTRTWTYTPTATFSGTPTFSNSPTPSFSSTPTVTFSGTPTFSDSPTPSFSSTPSGTATCTASLTDSPTVSFTPSQSFSFTASQTPSDSATQTPSFTESASATPTRSLTSTRTLTPTRSITPTFSISPTISQTPQAMPYQLKVAVYNSAGELVALLYSGGISQMPGAPQLSSGTVLAGVSGAALAFGGVLASGSSQVTWQGLTNAGDPARGGIYTLKTTVMDSFGNETSYANLVSVLEPLNKNEINVYNSAGERVYHAGLALSLGEPGISLELDTLSFAPLNKPLKGEIRGENGSVAPWSWDGRNEKGRLVTAGIYTVQLVADRAEGGQTKILRQVAVIAEQDGEDAGALALGSPVTEASLRKYGGLPLHYLASAVASGSARASLYDLSGRLTAKAEDPANSGLLILPSPQVAAGLYVAVFEYDSHAGSHKRKLIKIAVLR